MEELKKLYEEGVVQFGLVLKSYPCEITEFDRRFFNALVDISVCIRSGRVEPDELRSLKMEYYISKEGVKNSER